MSKLQTSDRRAVNRKRSVPGRARPRHPGGATHALHDDHDAQRLRRGWTPTPEAIAAMSKYNDELGKAGVLLTLDGPQPPSSGARVAFAGGRPTVTDGPFTEAKEMIGGYWLIQA